MSHDSNLRAKLETTRRTKLNRYSEMHFDAPIVDATLRRWFITAAHRNHGRVDGAERFGSLIPRILAHVLSDAADVALLGYMTGSREDP